MHLELRSGPAFCRYADESANVSKAVLKRGPTGVEGHSELLAAVKEVQHNLSFPKTTIISGLNMLVRTSEIQKSWKMTDSEETDFVTTVGRKIRNLCRVYWRKAN